MLLGWPDSEVLHELPVSSLIETQAAENKSLERLDIEHLRACWTSRL